MTATQDIQPTPLQSSESNFTLTLKRILELIELEEEDDYGILKPTEYAFKMVMELVIAAYESMGNNFPKASTSASTDEKGGISLEWTSQDRKRSVILFFPNSPDNPAYIYHDTSEEYAADNEVSDSNLVKWLEWYKRA